MEKIFESKVIDDLYEVRRDGFENAVIQKYGESQEIKQLKKVENELDNIVKENVKDEELRNKILRKIDEFKDALNGETCYWSQQYYKLGFSDKVGLKENVKQERKDFIGISDGDNIIEKNMDELADYIETEKVKRLKNRKEYKKLRTKVQKLKEKYPKVCKFIEDGKNDEFTREETSAILEIIELESSMYSIEQEEIFKFGVKEGSLFG